ncbi:MAG: hypothetical protein CMJ85_11305 [Planctomycetes bacterium]|nr:hypothetical protein [Planctomycetota bacterium]
MIQESSDTGVVRTQAADQGGCRESPLEIEDDRGYYTGIIFERRGYWSSGVLHELAQPGGTCLLRPHS